MQGKTLILITITSLLSQVDCLCPMCSDYDQDENACYRGCEWNNDKCTPRSCKDQANHKICVGDGIDDSKDNFQCYEDVTDHWECKTFTSCNALGVENCVQNLTLLHGFQVPKCQLSDDRQSCKDPATPGFISIPEKVMACDTYTSEKTCLEGVRLCKWSGTACTQKVCKDMAENCRNYTLSFNPVKIQGCQYDNVSSTCKEMDLSAYEEQECNDRPGFIYDSTAKQCKICYSFKEYLEKNLLAESSSFLISALIPLVGLLLVIN